MDAWQDLYCGCLSVESHLSKQIEEHQKAILKLKKDIEKNRKFFKENFDLSLDKCVTMSYNEYIKKKEKKER